MIAGRGCAYPIATVQTAQSRDIGKAAQTCANERQQNIYTHLDPDPCHPQTRKSGLVTRQNLLAYT